MFCVLFEVCPRPTQWDAYLGTAKMLRPELEHIDGFVDNIRYRGVTRNGWILSVSSWRDEKAVIRWRTKMRHHEAQEKGRAEILGDYHLRVGQVTRDTHVPAGHVIQEQRLDETEVGEETTAVLLDGKRPADCTLFRWMTALARRRAPSSSPPARRIANPISKTCRGSKVLASTTVRRRWRRSSVSTKTSW